MITLLGPLDAKDLRDAMALTTTIPFSANQGVLLQTSNYVYKQRLTASSLMSPECQDVPR